MKTLARWTTCLALLVTAAQGLSAQSRLAAVGPATEPPRDLLDDGEWGLGAIIDFIHKMSGPQFFGGGVTVFYQDSTSIRLRLTAVYRVSVDEAEEVDPDDSNITMLTLQPTVEFPVRGLPLEFAVGYALHRFGGDADEFWHHSFPLQAEWRPRSERRLVPRVGVGVHLFPAFDTTDFGPLVVDVSRDDNEAVGHFFVGLDYTFGR